MPVTVPFVGGMSNLGNTSGTSGIGRNQFLIAGGNNVTLSQSVSGQSVTVTISAGAGGGAGALTLGMSTGGNTSGTTGLVQTQYVFAGGNNVTLSQSVNGQSATLTISAANETVSFYSAGQSNIGNTSGDTGLASRRLVLAGGNNVTLSGSTNGGSMTITISGANETVSFYSAGISNVGNTSGDTGVVSRRLVLAGGNNVTLSGSTNGGSITVTISAANQTGSQYSAGISTLGNTAGDTGLASQRLVFAGSNVTLSGSTNGGSMTITISGNAAGAATGALTMGMSTDGNTSGTTGLVQSRYVFAGGNNITLSQSVNGESATLTISAGAAAPSMKYFDNAGPAQYTQLGTSNATLHLFPLNEGNNMFFPGQGTFGTMMFDASISTNGTVSAARTYTVSVGLYTLNDGTLSLINSGSTSWMNTANAGYSASYYRARWLTLDASLFSAALSFTQAQYVVGLWIRSSGTSLNMSWAGQNFALGSTQRSGTLFAASNNATSQGYNPFLGIYSASFTTAMPTQISISEIDHNQANATFQPRLVLNSLAGVF